MLHISAKSVGRKKPLFDDFAVPPPADLAGRSITLRDLIGHVVRAEVEAFRTRQSDRRLVKALTAKQIEDGLAAGKVQVGGSDLEQVVDADEAVGAALEAFGDGLYYVFVDDDQIQSLDALVPLAATSRVTFLRLTLLAGG